MQASQGYTPGSKVDLVWHSMKGSYELEGGTEFVGQKTEPTADVIKTVAADAQGNIKTSFVVPEDFGGSHDVRGSAGGEEISQASVTIMPTFTMAPLNGPIGTPIELKVTGLDWPTTSTPGTSCTTTSTSASSPP